MKNKLLLVILLIITCGCTKTPQYNTIITETKAIEILKEIDYKELGLVTKISSYELAVTSEIIIGTIKCYEIGAFTSVGSHKERLATFAVSKDGTKIYKHTEKGFILVE